SINQIFLEKIKHREKENPDQIDEVPKQTRNFNPIGEPLRVGFPELGAGPPKNPDNNGPAKHVQGMQRREGKINPEKSAMGRHKGRKALNLRDGDFQFVLGAVAFRPFGGLCLGMSALRIMSGVWMKRDGLDVFLLKVPCIPYVW